MYDLNNINVSQKYNSKIIRENAGETCINEEVIRIRLKLLDEKNEDMPYPGDMAYLLIITCPSYLIFLPSDPLPCSSFA